MAREIVTFLLLSIVAFLLGNGYYKSFRNGVLTIKGRTYRRDKEPIGYWISIAIGTLAFLLMVSGTAVMAFLVCVHLSRNSK